MKNKKRMDRKEAGNPYLVSYLSFALICAISLGLVFLLISINIFKKEQAVRERAKLELVSENMQKQLLSMRKVGVGITADSIYYPKYFSETKYYEVELLKNFEQYLSRFSMVDEILLYYGDGRVFLSSGSISAFDVYFQDCDEAEREEILRWLNSPSWDGFSFLKMDALYIGISLRFDGMREDTAVKLCFEIGRDTFTEYFELLGGIRNGEICLYYGEDCLYSNLDEGGGAGTAAGGSKKGRNTKDSIVIQDRIYGLTYLFLPDHSVISGKNYIALTVSLILSVILWILLMVYLFAGRAYKPIKLFMEQCRKNMAWGGNDFPAETDSPVGERENSPEEKKVFFRGKVIPLRDRRLSFRDNLEEMGEAIEELLIQHKEARERLDIEEKRLEEIVLRSFLKGEHTDIISKYAEFIRINLNGMFFFVCSVFLEEKMLRGEFTNSDREVLEQRICEKVKRASVHVLSRTSPNDMSIICCLRRREDRQMVLEAIKTVAGEFCRNPFVECGGTYDNLSKLSASYFESLDRLNGAKNVENRNSSLLCGTEISSKGVLQFFVFLREGKEKNALEELHRFVKTFEKEEISFLVQQYFFAEFIYKITNIARESDVEVETQFLSLLISAGNLKEFEEAAELVVHRFCDVLRARELEAALGESREIIEYIRQHFAEYDLSLEGVARILDVSAESVRSSIRQQTGKSYKEYVLSLRMIYSRKLLIEEGLSVEETSRRVGYANASYFIRLFKKEYGITPADYKAINEVA